MKVYKYREVSDQNLESLFSNQIYAAEQSKLNDPFEMSIDKSDLLRGLCNLKPISNIDSVCIEDWTKRIIKMSKISACYSLSKNVKNELLWAHYANGHKGLCIEYDYSILKDYLLRDESIRKYDCAAGFEVFYTDFPPKLTVDNILNKADDNIQIIKDVLGTKSKVWEYEKEVRIIFMSSGLKQISPSCITGIYFGLKMSDSDKEKIRMNMQISYIEYYQMKRINNSYLLDVDLVKDECIYKKHRKI